MLSTKILSAEHLRQYVLGGLPGWAPPYVDDLLDTLTSSDTPFPCTFAVSAAKRGGLRFGFVEDVDDQDSWHVLPGIISSYLDIYRGISRRTSLIVMFRRQPRVVELSGYYERFWRVLQFLHDHDPAPWPAEIPKQVEDSRWEFSFRGTPMFVVCNTPAYTRRRSRSSPGFMITFQPRWVFEELAPDTTRGSATRRVIRQRLRAFDDVEPSPELGGYGHSGNREWRQYFLPEDNGADLPGCPFRHNDARAVGE